MSKGIGGSCYKISETNKIVIYKYSVYNLNNKILKNSNSNFDGEIIVKKNLKFKINKEKKNEILTNQIFSENFIVKNSKNSFKKTTEGYDFIAVILCYKIFKIYQNKGVFLEKINYDI